jgi:hypothetical protein
VDDDVPDALLPLPDVPLAAPLVEPVPELVSVAVPVPLTVPEAERLPEVPVVLLAVVLGEVVDAVVSVALLLAEPLGVEAVVVPGVVVVVVVVLLRSQPVAAAVARARAAITGKSFFMTSPVQSVQGGSLPARGEYIEPALATRMPSALHSGNARTRAARSCRREEYLREELQA